MKLFYILFLYLSFFKSFNSISTSDTIINLLYDETSKTYEINTKIGSDIKNYSFSYDINADWSYVSGQNCDKCTGNKFNTTDSKTFTTQNNSLNSSYYYNFTEMNVSGIIGEDYFEFLLLNSSNLKLNKSFPFIVVANSSNLSSLDGILAFSKNSIKTVFNDFTSFKSKIITQKIFSNKTGKLIIGNFPKEIISGDESFTRCQFKTDRNWECELTHIILGNFTKLTDGYNVSNENQFQIAKFSTLINEIVAPYEIYNYLDKNYFKSCNQTVNEDITRVICNEKIIQNISFVLNNVAYRLNESSLFSENNNFNIVFKKNQNTWTFGQCFLSQFYTIFDFDSSYIGFYGGIKTDFNKSTTMVYIIIGISIFVIIIISIFLMIDHLQNKEDHHEKEYKAN